MKLDHQEKLKQGHKLAFKRIEGRIRDSNINEYIVFLTYVSNHPGHNGNTITSPNLIEKIIKVYGYLRDETGAQTVGEAIDNIVEGKIKSEITEFWEKEGMHDTFLYDALNFVHVYKPTLRDINKIRLTTER